jgi:hypothetical protein
MVRNISVIVLFYLLLSFGIAVAGDSEKEKAALTAAEKWLALVDAGKYTNSWEEAAAAFKKAVSVGQWNQAVASVRKPLGKLMSRKLMTKSYQTSLPGAPDGEYVVIQFESSFAHKKAAIETVTPMLNKDGSWRVSGYFIK